MNKPARINCGQELTFAKANGIAADSQPRRERSGVLKWQPAERTVANSMTGSKNVVSAKLHHSDALRFNVDVGGRGIELDSAEEMGNAFSPMELFLVALAGCTAMDVQWILGRQRQKVDRFDMTVSGTRREEDPRYYESIDINYNLAGSELRKDAVERAIRLSQEKYCSVRAMLKDTVKLNVTYTVANGTQPSATYTYASS